MTDVKAELLEALRAAQSFIADGGHAGHDPGASIYRKVSSAITRAESQPALPEGVEAVAWPGGWLVKDFADGWYWTGDRLNADMAANGGACVYRIDSGEYETEPLATPLPTGRGLDEVREAVERLTYILSLVDDGPALWTHGSRQSTSVSYNDLRAILASLGGVDKGALRPSPLVLVLCESILHNDDPSEPIADNGGTVLDGWRDLATRILAAPDPTPPASQEGES